MCREQTLRYNRPTSGAKTPTQNPKNTLNRYDAMRYDTRYYFNVRSKADMSQLNLPHESPVGNPVIFASTDRLKKFAQIQLFTEKSSLSQHSLIQTQPEVTRLVGKTGRLKPDHASGHRCNHG